MSTYTLNECMSWNCQVHYSMATRKNWLIALFASFILPDVLPTFSQWLRKVCKICNYDSDLFISSISTSKFCFIYIQSRIIDTFKQDFYVFLSNNPLITMKYPSLESLLVLIFLIGFLVFWWLHGVSYFNLYLCIFYFQLFSCLLPCVCLCFDLHMEFSSLCIRVQTFFFLWGHQLLD